MARFVHEVWLTIQLPRKEPGLLPASLPWLQINNQLRPFVTLRGNAPLRLSLRGLSVVSLIGSTTWYISQ